MGIGMVRTKAMAVLLGTSGFGLFSLYWNISELARIVAGMGINSSGVRQIAEAVGTGDEKRVARTVTTLRRVSLVLGIMGAVLLLSVCVPVSLIAFGDRVHAGAIALDVVVSGSGKSGIEIRPHRLQDEHHVISPKHPRRLITT